MKSPNRVKTGTGSYIYFGVFLFRINRVAVDIRYREVYRIDSDTVHVKVVILRNQRPFDIPKSVVEDRSRNVSAQIVIECNKMPKFWEIAQTFGYRARQLVFL